MAKIVLLTNADKVKLLTSLSGTIDSEKLTQWIKVAQDIEIQNILGSKLMDKVLADVSASSLTGDYLTMVDDYVVPVLCFYAAMNYVEKCVFDVSNGGIQIRRGESSESASLGEVKYLSQRYRDDAEHYAQRLKDWLCANSNKVPEYNQNVNGDVYPDHSPENFQGLFLG